MLALDADSSVVLKENTSDAYGELVASRLLRVLLGNHESGVRVPFCVGARRKEDYAKLIETLRTVKISKKHTCASLHQSDSIKSGALLFTFLHGETLEDFSFPDDDALRIRLFHQFGEIAAADALINNGDRIPILWTHAGNRENVLISAPRRSAGVVDSAYAPIGDANLKSLHFDKLEKMVKRSRRLEDDENDVFDATLDEFFRNPSAADKTEFWRGVRCGFLRATSDETRTRLIEAFQEAKRIASESEFALVRNGGASSDDGSFLYSCIDVVNRTLQATL